jgi:hypothetical protein
MSDPHALSAELVAVIVAVTDGTPRVLTLAQAPRLPSGPFARDDRSLQSGLRNWVERQTGRRPAYVEQLYTFADRDRVRPSAGDDGGLGRVISVSYLGLARESPNDPPRPNAVWRDWYSFFPWEDRRGPAVTAPAEALAAWAEARPAAGRQDAKRRVAFAFASGEAWNEDLALARYELLHEAGFVAEAHRNRPAAGPTFGLPMPDDHRRILATAIARLRAKIKYRALVFELMPDEFTLLDLQRTIEALSGRNLHKQNFRRLIAAQDLVEDTGRLSAVARGRPAKLFRFRGAVVEERALATTRLPLARS